jgi:ribosomal protein S12
MKNKQKKKPSHASGTVTERVGVETKSPNSGIRKCFRIELKTGEKVLAFAPFDGGFNFIDENDTVFLERRSGGDIPGVTYKIIKTNGVLLEKMVYGRVVHSDLGKTYIWQ